MLLHKQTPVPNQVCRVRPDHLECDAVDSAYSVVALSLTCLGGTEKLLP